MTVRYVEGVSGNDVTCQWIDAQRRPHVAPYFDDQLMHVPGADVPLMAGAILSASDPSRGTPSAAIH